MSSQLQSLSDISPINSAKPFLKWAGGKRQLIPQIEAHFPPELFEGALTHYAEPFVGGGAMLFHIANLFPNLELTILDVNREVFIVYKTIQNDVKQLISYLGELETAYLSLSAENRQKFYYQRRTLFNSQLSEVNVTNYSADWIIRAANIIFLNRTCFNGLFRVNSKGEFNVPFGRYKNPKICDQENLVHVSNVLKRCQIIHGDFSSIDKFVNSQSFVYFDPPYRPISSTASFNSYSEDTFGDESQLRLANFFERLHKKGAKLILSDSDPKHTNPDDNFFEDAYRKFRIERVFAKRNINSSGSKRGAISELLIMNY